MSLLFLFGDPTMSIATLIRNADLYAPEHVGHRDILVAGGKIIALAERLEPNIPGMETIDAVAKATCSSNAIFKAVKDALAQPSKQ